MAFMPPITCRPQGAEKRDSGLSGLGAAAADAGVPENQLTLFSTLNLHIFQTITAACARSADGSEWIYGDIDLVTQFIQDGQELKPWLEEMGSTSWRIPSPP